MIYHSLQRVQAPYFTLSPFFNNHIYPPLLLLRGSLVNEIKRQSKFDTLSLKNFLRLAVVPVIRFFCNYALLQAPSRDLSQFLSFSTRCLVSFIYLQKKQGWQKGEHTHSATVSGLWMQ